MPVIENIIIKNTMGRDMEVPKIDEDGDIVWRDRDKGEFDVSPALASDLIRLACLSIPKSLQRGDDFRRVPRVLNAVERQKNAEHVELKPKLYDWFQRLLKRPVPNPDNEYTPTYAQELWELNSALIVYALTDIDSRQSIENWDEED
jgi:hypothetical protein